MSDSGELPDLSKLSELPDLSNLGELPDLNKSGELPDLNKSGKLTAFLISLLSILSDPANKEMIEWSDNGKSFCVLDEKSLEDIVLSRYFKHKKFLSFLRQLNNYDFAAIEIDGTKYYQHKYFIRDQPELLSQIKRKPPSIKQSVEKVKQLTEAAELDQQTIQQMAKKITSLKKKLKKMCFYKKKVKERRQRNPRYMINMDNMDNISNMVNNHISCDNSNQNVDIIDDVDSYDENIVVKIEPSLYSFPNTGESDHAVVNVNNNISVKIEPFVEHNDDDSWTTYFSDQ